MRNVHSKGIARGLKLFTTELTTAKFLLRMQTRRSDQRLHISEKTCGSSGTGSVSPVNPTPRLGPHTHAVQDNTEENKADNQPHQRHNRPLHVLVRRYPARFRARSRQRATRIFGRGAWLL